MKTFEYRGYDSAGRPRHGMVEAQDLKAAREALAAAGVLPERVAPAAGGGTQLFRRRGTLPAAARVMLYHELGVLLESGMPLLQALGVLAGSPEMESARLALGNVRDLVREGTSLADALARAWPLLPGFEPAIIAVGEKSGSLAVSLQKLALFVEEQQRIREKVQAALLYPAIIMTFAMVIAIVMLGFVIPSASRILTETARIPIPLLTRIMTAAGKFFLWGLGPAILFAVGAREYLRRRAARDAVFEGQLDRRLFGMPIIGRGYMLLVNLRFARTLAILLNGGVAIVDGMSLAARASGSPWVALCVAEETERVRHGSTLADAIRRVPPLAGVLPGWIQSGEASGALARLLDTAAGSFQYRWEKYIARILSLLEPVLIVCIGAFVLLVVLSVLLPVLAMSRALG